MLQLTTVAVRLHRGLLATVTVQSYFQLTIKIADHFQQQDLSLSVAQGGECYFLAPLYYRAFLVWILKFVIAGSLLGLDVLETTVEKLF